MISIPDKLAECSGNFQHMTFRLDEAEDSLQAAFALFGLLPLVVAVQVGLAFGFGVGLAVFFVEFSALFLWVFAMLNRISLQSCK